MHDPLRLHTPGNHHSLCRGSGTFIYFRALVRSSLCDKTSRLRMQVYVTRRLADFLGQGQIAALPALGHASGSRWEVGP